MAPWNVLGGGKFRTDEEEKRRLESGEKGRTFASPEWLRNETEVKVSRALEKVAKEVGAKQITAGKRWLFPMSLAQVDGWEQLQLHTYNRRRHLFSLSLEVVK